METRVSRKDVFFDIFTWNHSLAEIKKIHKYKVLRTENLVKGVLFMLAMSILTLGIWTIVTGVRTHKMMKALSKPTKTSTATSTIASATLPAAPSKPALAAGLATPAPSPPRAEPLSTLAHSPSRATPLPTPPRATTLPTPAPSPPRAEPLSTPPPPPPRATPLPTPATLDPSVAAVLIKDVQSCEIDAVKDILNTAMPSDKDIEIILAISAQAYGPPKNGILTLLLDKLKSTLSQKPELFERALTEANDTSFPILIRRPEVDAKVVLNAIIRLVHGASPAYRNRLKELIDATNNARFKEISLQSLADLFKRLPGLQEETQKSLLLIRNAAGACQMVLDDLKKIKLELLKKEKNLELQNLLLNLEKEQQFFEEFRKKIPKF